jgi:enoyl-CoA hydratase/carnithine racemase
MTAQEVSITRIPIFNYNTFTTNLIPITKTLEIKFKESFFNQELLFELESILAWSATHQEIQSILFTSHNDVFLQGVEVSELSKMNEEKCQKFLFKISTLTKSLLCLPQTIIVDLKNGAKGAGLEFALAADIRIACLEANFQFNYLSNGLVPSAGLFSFLKPYLNQNILRSLLLSEKIFYNSELMALGSTVDLNIGLEKLLLSISKQSPIARIQAKLGLQQNQKDIEEKILLSVLFTEDYKQIDNFMAHTAYKEKIREIN